MLIPIPNIIIFQYNPETLSRTLKPWQPPERALSVNDQGNIERAALSNEQKLALSQPYDPEETFSLDLVLDASDALEHPETHPVAFVSGVADRVAAIEMLMYPPGDGLLGGLMGTISGSVSVSAGGVSVGGGLDAAMESLEQKKVPIVLLFWGPGRIVPVRITSLSIEEQEFSPLLYPIKAKANIGIRVLTIDDLVEFDGDPASGATVEIAKACYLFTRGQKEILAAANLANSVESIINMLPI
jgi:hypothetical protein